MMIYPDLTNFLNEHLEGFSSERIEVKNLINRILTLTIKHNSDENAVIMSVKFLKEVLKTTPETFNKINLKYKFYEIDKQYSRGSARKLYPNPIVLDLLTGAIVSECRNVLRLLDDEFTENDYKNILLSIDRNIVFPVGVKIDTMALHDYCTKSYSIPAKKEALNLMTLSNNTSFKFGEVPQLYRRANSGRLYGVPISIQMTRKDVRNAAMNGYWDYDFTNCHGSILAQQEGNYPALEDYVANTKKFREDICTELGMEINSENITIVKRALLAMFYGAGKSIRKGSVITDTLGKERAKLFWDSTKIGQLKAESDKAIDVLIERKGVVYDESNRYKIAANTVQGVESELLTAAAKIADPSIFIFDGWIGKDTDVNFIEMTIKHLTAYTIEVKKSKIEYEWGTSK